MSNKEFLERLKNIDMIYKTDENGNVSENISCGETYENHFKQLEKDLDELEELKKIMGTPIQEIMKKLRKLEVIEKHYIYDDKETRFNLIKPITIEDDEILKEV